LCGPTKRQSKRECSLTTRQNHGRAVKHRGQLYGSEFFQRIKRASAIEQKAIRCRHRYARAVTGHRDITGSGAQFISRFAPTASGANGAKKSAVSADSIFIDTGKQLGRIYYFTRARAARRCFCLLSRNRVLFAWTVHNHVSYRRYLRVSFWMVAIFCDVPITFEKFDWSKASQRLDQRDTKLMHMRRSSIIELLKVAANTINPLPSEIMSSNAILNLLFIAISITTIAIPSTSHNGTINIFFLCNAKFIL